MADSLSSLFMNVGLAIKFASVGVTEAWFILLRINLLLQWVVPLIWFAEADAQREEHEGDRIPEIMKTDGNGNSEAATLDADSYARFLRMSPYSDIAAPRVILALSVPSCNATRLSIAAKKKSALCLFVQCVNPKHPKP